MIDRETGRSGYLEQFRLWSFAPAAFGQRTKLRLEALVRLALQVLLMPAVLIAALAMVVALRGALSRRRSMPPSTIHDEAMASVPDLATQYPFHFYPLVAKALELAYVKDVFARRAPYAGGDRIIEVAIGEGSFSARVFASGTGVTGLDLNPHSLAFAAALPHVGRAIVCDGIEPPIRPGSFDVLFSANFLHHVTDKKGTLANWSRIARTLVFNENTTYWASGWVVPQVLKRLGLGAAARRSAMSIEQRSLQHLHDRSTLDEQVRSVCEIEEQVSFLSQSTFVRCGLFSFLMRCYGPPTPALLKRIFLGPLRRVAIPLTIELARLLITFDRYQDRGRDAFVFYVCRSRAFISESRGEVALCARCGSVLSATRCEACGASFPLADGMLFLLPERWAYLYEDYTGRATSRVPSQHL